MRPLSVLTSPSAPGRFAVWIVTSLAVAACAGCMSVGEEEESPAPVRSSDRHGTAKEPDGVTGSVTGVAGGRQGRAGMDGVGRIDAESTAKEPSPGPSSSVEPSAGPSREGEGPRPAKPSRPGTGPTQPSKEPAPPQQTPPQPPPAGPGPGHGSGPGTGTGSGPGTGTGTGPGSQDPDPGSDPDPAPSDPPSASPQADVRTGFFPGAEGVGLKLGMKKEPAASPQLGPV
ncbi:hypothetical protein [Streptomyces sp. NPDC088725]|uniref:hypothetical protein n=1 Tax=Streptomyces sp. NPDC088725 TaxID=3365873 RepID=UPI0037F25471